MKILDIIVEGMPAGLIKIKQKLYYMSDEDFARGYASRSDDELRAMAWRHGYGQGSSYYVDKRNRGKEKMGSVEEGTGVTDYTPASQGGTRAELLAKYHKTKDPKDAEAARKAGATQRELAGVKEGKKDSDLISKDSRRWKSVMGDFDRIMTRAERESPGGEEEHQSEVKRRLKTEPMAGPKAKLPKK